MIPHFNDERDWFFEKRYGMFVHWGLYAINGWHEQEMWRKHVRRHKYAKLLQKFNPVHFDPEAWLDLAEEAGMEYICITTKHHDGFCLWDTKYTDFNVMNTPYKKDIIGMLAELCHKRGFPLELYYSCVDWHHPNYPNQGRHHEMPWPEEDDEPDMARYMEFVKNQLRELCSHYGSIHGIFWDMNVPKHIDPSINQLIRSLQPAAVINDRGYDSGDYGTPERDYQKDSLDQQRMFSQRTEACQALGMMSWGYREEEDYYSSKYMMQSMDKMFAMGANYLLNVGPKADGTIGEPCVSRLKTIGSWYRSVREAFDQAEPASYLIKNKDILATRKGNDLYLHFYADPKGSGVVIEPLEILPKRSVLLNNGQELTVVRNQGTRYWQQSMEYVRLKNIPVEAFVGEVMVVRLEFDQFPETSLKAEMEKDAI